MIDGSLLPVPGIELLISGTHSDRATRLSGGSLRRLGGGENPIPNGFFWDGSVGRGRFGTGFSESFGSKFPKYAFRR